MHNGPNWIQKWCAEPDWGSVSTLVANMPSMKKEPEVVADQQTKFSAESGAEQGVTPVTTPDRSVTPALDQGERPTTTADDKALAQAGSEQGETPVTAPDRSATPPPDEGERPTTTEDDEPLAESGPEQGTTPVATLDGGATSPPDQRERPTTTEDDEPLAESEPGEGATQITTSDQGDPSSLDHTGHPVSPEQQAFLFQLLDALDRRRSAIDARSAVVFAITGAAIGFILTQAGSGGFLQAGDHVQQCVLITILAVLFAALLFGLALVAPIPRTRTQRRSQASTPSLSYFWRISQSTEADYRRLIATRTPGDIFFDSCRQVHSLSHILRIRYERLRRTCRWLYVGLFLLALYVLLTLSHLL